MAKDKEIINRKRIRKICGSFSWVDHKIITKGFLDDLSTAAIVLYFFLTAVSDRHGLSYYHDDRICRLLKLDLSSLGEAREDLIQRFLIAYNYPIYQVLALPDKPISPPTAEELAEAQRKIGLSYIKKFREVIGERRVKC
jgi:hypothetical protein